MLWFPDPYFPIILGLLVLGTLFIDYAVPRVLEWHCPVYLIRLLGLVSIIAAVVFRLLSWTVAPDAVQYIGLVLIHVGLSVREWAMIRRGQLVRRGMQMERGPRLVTDGPYRWLRHPIYAGMILNYVGISLALGTWAGGIVTLGSVLAATVYRIRIEERAFVEAYGKEYRDYMRRTWRLFPGW